MIEGPSRDIHENSQRLILKLKSRTSQTGYGTRVKGYLSAWRHIQVGPQSPRINQ
ncbi:MAG: hypothetical protein KIH08_09900 [Candidatus Freyarchaeota archaeon]|nr:hypothetical protein [Candidatus Jordarchaeia archaeon]MBS7270314.1 hypothetical protein [Candidatus Jordarchaeia archaeon]MBS7281036.1 hypothetical protein [Candidatus Jordarchaeia archaeon]